MPPAEIVLIVALPTSQTGSQSRESIREDIRSLGASAERRVRETREAWRGDRVRCLNQTGGKDSTAPRVRTVSWGGPAISAQAARSLCGVHFVQRIMRGQILAPPIFDLLGFRLVRVEPGKVACEFEPAEFHYNPMAAVHGGVVGTLLGSVMGLAVHAHLSAGSLFSTLELKVNFIRPSGRRPARSWPRARSFTAVHESRPKRVGSSTRKASSMRTVSPPACFFPPRSEERGLMSRLCLSRLQRKASPSVRVAGSARVPEAAHSRSQG